MVNVHHKEVLIASTSKGAELSASDAEHDDRDNRSSSSSEDLNLRGFTDEETKVLSLMMSLKEVELFRNEMSAYRDFTACDVPKFDGVLDPIASTRWPADVKRHQKLDVRVAKTSQEALQSPRWLWRGWLLYLPAVLSLFSLILFLLIVMGVALLRGCIVMVLIEPWVWVEHCGSLVGIVVGRRCSDLLGGNRCVTKIVLLEFKSVPLTSRFVDRCHDEELFGEVLETSPLLSERDSLEVDWHIRISLQEFVILPVKELSRKKRVVRSSLVVMDPAGRRSSQLLA
ncbi:hypothetical protein Tco_1313430 [Tanacetum coccineum]